MGIRSSIHPIALRITASTMSSFSIKITLILCLTGILVRAQSLDLPYNSGSTGADGPFSVPTPAGPVSGFGIAYDAERAQVVRFGGDTGIGATSTTWVLRAGG